MNSTLRLVFSIFFILTSFPVVAATVTIQDFSFSPSITTINIGDSISWLNQDGTEHSTTQDANLWSSDLAGGESFSRKFTTPGTFNYHCRFHSSMTGTIVVNQAQTTSDSDRVFAYLEAVYPQYLSPSGSVSSIFSSYYYRYYSVTQAYIATANGTVYYLGPASQNTIISLGTLNEWLTTAASSGF